MNTEVLQESLSSILFKKLNSNDRAKLSISLCNYYGSEKMEDEVKNELTKLNKNLVNYELFDQLKFNLTEAIRRRFYEGNRFEEHNQHMHQPEALNIINIDLTSLITELGKIREVLSTDPVDFNVLIQFISKRAKEAGDLNQD